MSYHDRLDNLRKIQKRAPTVLTEPTKGPFGSFVSTQPPRFRKNQASNTGTAEASKVADLDPGTLEAMLSPEDRKGPGARQPWCWCAPTWRPVMGWREVLGYTSESDTQYPQNTQNPEPPPSFGDIGDIGERDSMSTPGIAEAARAAGMAPDTLAALLSNEDHADLDAGLLTSDELAAYARSVSGRWARGFALADEAELVTAERVRRDPLADLPLMREDRTFIERCLVGRGDRHDLLTEYRRRWLAAAEAEGNEIRRDNAGRHAANDWLRSLSTSQSR